MSGRLPEGHSWTLATRVASASTRFRSSTGRSALWRKRSAATLRWPSGNRGLQRAGVGHSALRALARLIRASRSTSVTGS